MGTLIPVEAVERSDAATVHNVLRDAVGATHLSRVGGSTVPLPAPVVDALKAITGALMEGRSVTIVASNEEVTTQAAADLLNVSRPHLITLLDRDEIPYHRVGTHRRLYAGDVLAYKHARDRAREQALNDLMTISEDVEDGYR